MVSMTALEAAHERQIVHRDISPQNIVVTFEGDVRIVDSLDAARYLKDSEEYWPFEGDDWPDEYVGGEGLR